NFALSCHITSDFHIYFFFLHSSLHHRALHSFPTRRSSDLIGRAISRLLPLLISTGVKLGWTSAKPSSRRRIAPRRFVRKSGLQGDRKSTRLNSSHVSISYAVFCLKKKKKKKRNYKHRIHE